MLEKCRWANSIKRHIFVSGEKLIDDHTFVVLMIMIAESNWKKK